MEAYQELVRRVLTNGTYNTDQHGLSWVSSFHESYTIDLQDGFPLLTTRKMGDDWWDLIVDQTIWALSGERNIQSLTETSPVQEQKATDNGELPTARGRFWRRYPVPQRKAMLADEAWPTNTSRWVTVENTSRNVRVTFDQVQYIIDRIKEEPKENRLVLTAWHPANGTHSSLPPSDCICIFDTLNGKLNAHLTQLDGSVTYDVPVYLAEYSLLTHIIADEVGLNVGSFGHTIVNASIQCGRGERGKWYKDNLPLVQDTLPDELNSPSEHSYTDVRSALNNKTPETPNQPRRDRVPELLQQLSRTPKQPPSVELANTSLDTLTADDISLQNYESHPRTLFGYRP